ncbi:pentapeptide repeat-containing protein [Geitlerinema sp. PCC 7407]|uniref:pentapeptide repeat-containing protein n=1 Tax=Geitlerinema sp. PCC 7407 TaxID=1173025 RepID=UPI00031C3A32|nr:pentapeptide repeat-containing protein [Geitlerinema sp. PCC 7407]
MGIPIWNQWRSHFIGQIDFSKADLRDAYLSSADLTKVKLKDAKLDRAYLPHADLSHADLSHANLSGANLSGANLSEAKLIGSDLTGANLTRTILSKTNFTGADLSNVNLSKAQCSATIFSKATLTGSCLQDWILDTETQFFEVICDYFYGVEGCQKRRPQSSSFAPGEFSALIHKVSDTIDLIFVDGIDWKPFLLSFQELRDKYGDANLSVQAIEKKKDEAFIIRLEVAAEVNKTEIEKTLKQEYNYKLKAQEKLLTLQDQQLVEYRQHNTELLRIIRVMAEKEESRRNINTGGGNYIESNSGGYAEGNYVNYINMNQNLTHAASQIQALIDQLQSQGMDVDVAKEKVAADIANQAKNNPSMQAKLLKWGQSVGNATVSDVVQGVVKLAIRSAGLPLP